MPRIPGQRARSMPPGDKDGRGVMAGIDGRGVSVSRVGEAEGDGDARERLPWGRQGEAARAPGARRGPRSRRRWVRFPYLAEDGTGGAKNARVARRRWGGWTEVELPTEVTDQQA